MKNSKASAIAGLLTGALVWGLIWYPYRVLEARGISATNATLASYAVALVLSLVLFRRELPGLLRADVLLVAIAVTSGWTNLAYVLGMVHGEVMQVLLLFYLAPLWTVFFARALLGERAGALGLLIVALSLCGAGLMLWRPGLRLPLPDGAAEWFGLTAGVTFALANVLIRKAHAHSIRLKAVAVFTGVVLVAGAMLPFEGGLEVPSAPAAGTLVLLLGIGVVLLVANLAVQHGLTRVSSNQAIVILLSELIVAAASAYLLAGESMHWNQWIGGTLIVAATLLSGRLGENASS
ncbi:MAG: DMT family transporter [Burkholderiales bacterium]|nr:DMT family transporter [Burkholderiales bacterium]